MEKRTKKSEEKTSQGHSEAERRYFGWRSCSAIQRASFLGRESRAGEGIGAVAILGFGVLYIAGIWSGLAIQVKRWHDMDKSGWMVLLNFIPLANLVVLIMCGAFRGTVGPNRFGGDPT